MKTHLKHRVLCLCLPAALVSCFSSRLPPDSPHKLSSIFLRQRRNTSPCAMGDVETDFGCLMTDGYWYLLCRVTVSTGQCRKFKKTASQRNFRISKAGLGQRCTWQGCPPTIHLERWHGSLPADFLGQNWLDPNAPMRANWLGTIGWP